MFTNSVKQHLCFVALSKTVAFVTELQITAIMNFYKFDVLSLHVYSFGHLVV